MPVPPISQPLRVLAPGIFRPLALILAVAVAVVGTGLAACDPDVHTRGNLASASALEEIRVGQSSRAQVASALGTPSTTSLFDKQETWFYIGAQTQQYAIWPTEELSRQVVAITFDKQGIIESVKLLDKDDGTQLAVVDRTTPTAGRELNIIQQLLGNIGRFSPSPK
jgi:outer membrane protein assembly factor BamE (lipoprotein component of BamABCDE complex)